MCKHKRVRFSLLLFACVILCYVLWLTLRPVKIVAVHEDRHFSDILVKSFPFTDKGKITWWLKNKDMLKDKYGLPKPDSDGAFMIVFWLFEDGYKVTDGYDRLCFSDLEPPMNCIEKNRVFSVETGRNDNILLTVDDGIYRMKKDGTIVKIKYK